MKTPRVTHIDHGPRPYCEHRVRRPMSDTREWRHRVYRADRLGIPHDQCAAPSAFLFDGRPMCTAHAGWHALSHLLGEKV